MVGRSSTVLAAYMPDAAREALLQPWSKFAQSLSGVVEDHSGRVVDVGGPGWFVATFEDARQGTLCAATIQRSVNNTNDEAEGASPCWLHIGLNAEEAPDSSVTWPPKRDDSVDRLVSLAEPGGVCLSRTIYDAVRFQVDLPFDTRRDPNHTAYACQEIRGKLGSLNLLESGAVHLSGASLGYRELRNGALNDKDGASTGIIEKLRSLLSNGSQR